MLTQLTPATGWPVSVEEVKAHALIEGDDQDNHVELMRNAAVEYVARHCSQALAPASYQWATSAWPQAWNCPAIELPLYPVREVTSIVYLDQDHAEQPVSSADYVVELTAEGASIYFENGFSFPTLSTRPNPVRVIFDAGYDDPEASGSGDEPRLQLPHDLKLAILMLAATFFEYREEVTASEAFKNDLGARMLAQHRIFR